MYNNIFFTIALCLTLGEGANALLDIAEILLKHSQEFLMNGTDCKIKTGATEEDIATFFRKKLPDTKTGDCMIACMMEKMQVLKDGKYMDDAAHAIAKSILGHEDMIADLIGDVGKNCAKKVPPGELCDTAKGIAQCGLDHVKKFREMVKSD